MKLFIDLCFQIFAFLLKSMQNLFMPVFLTKVSESANSPTDAIWIFIRAKELTQNFTFNYSI